MIQGSQSEIDIKQKYLQKFSWFPIYFKWGKLPCLPQDNSTNHRSETQKSMWDVGGQHTAISRKVVGKNVHATNPKGNMGYNQYTVPDDCSCRTYFCCFPLALANTFPWPFVPILSNFFEKQRTQNHPQYLSRLSRALFPTTFLEIAV